MAAESTFWTKAWVLFHDINAFRPKSSSILMGLMRTRRILPALFVLIFKNSVEIFDPSDSDGD